MVVLWMFRHKTRAHIGLLVKDTSAKLKQASEADHHAQVTVSQDSGLRRSILHVYRHEIMFCLQNPTPDYVYRLSQYLSMVNHPSCIIISYAHIQFKFLFCGQYVDLVRFSEFMF